MRKRVLKRTLSVVLVCVMLMSIFAALPMQASAAAKKNINDLKWSTPKNAYYSLGYTPTWNFTIKDPKTGRYLVKNQDFTISYSSKSMGHSVATFKGKGKYTGTKLVQLTIIPRPLSDCVINAKFHTVAPALIPAYDVSMSVKFYDGDNKVRTAKEGVHYTWSTKETVNEYFFGYNVYYTITVKGKNCLSGKEIQEYTLHAYKQ